MKTCNLVSPSIEGACSNSPVPTFESLLDSVRLLFPVLLQASDVLPNPGATIPINESHIICDTGVVSSPECSGNQKIIRLISIIHNGIILDLVCGFAGSVGGVRAEDSFSS